MFAQGSTAIGTTVKPKRDDEFDLDFVLQVEGWNGSPMALCNAVYSRLSAHGMYSSKLKPMRRCVRIEYAGEFHLDIVPAVLIASPTPTNILITDSNTQSWTSSNPKGFARWFLNRARTSLTKAERKIEPLPTQTPAQQNITFVSYLVFPLAVSQCTWHAALSSRSRSVQDSRGRTRQAIC